MLFNSFAFAAFFSVVVAIYFACRRRLAWQNGMLLVASYFFYGWWDWRFLGLIMASTLIDFVCGKVLDRRVEIDHNSEGGEPAPYARTEKTRRAVLLLSVAANLGILGFFKYYDFFAASCAELLDSIGLPMQPRLLHIILPIGISFYTFQTLSYTIDVYRGKLRAHNNLLEFSLFVAFFPQLVAGPIVRARDFLPQVMRRRELDWAQMYEGCYLVLWGLFKKIIIADNVAVVVDRVFDGDIALQGGAVVVALYAFSLQIYCDFSGYTDIARGCAKILGFEIGLNFNLPYLSASPGEFWQRWHISLSTWLRDYLYVPLGGSRKGKRRTLINMMLTMFLGGLWHGAAWTFVVWGLYQGLLLVVYKLLAPGWTRLTTGWSDRRRCTAHWVGVLFFFQLWCLGWPLFRAESLDQTWSILSALLVPWSIRGTGITTLAICALPVIAMQLAQYYRNDLNVVLRLPAPMRGLVYAALFIALTVFFGEQVEEPFIYFQF